MKRLSRSFLPANLKWTLNLHTSWKEIFLKTAQGMNTRSATASKDPVSHHKCIPVQEGPTHTTTNNCYLIPCNIDTLGQCSSTFFYFSHTMSSRARELLEQIAQIIMVAKCKCAWQRSKSMTHINCLRIDSWIVDELIETVTLARMENDSSDGSVMYPESLDSLK